MDQNSPDKAKYRGALKSQLRENYGKVVYTHKTHEKAADILLSRNNKIKLWQLILSAVTTGTLIVTLFSDGNVATLIAAIISTILLILNTYTKDFDMVTLAEKHKVSAQKLWEIREEYLSLLTDFNILSVEEIREKRETLQNNLKEVNLEAPRTNSKAYQKAQKALKDNEELSFSDSELDALLPNTLKRQKYKDGSHNIS